ncbi:hypothetical protein [Burkholderia cenocepacia]|uniref:hypothetical protein n=1 Tax=Burkholderia cenocepacia TaxID=95486 RepID=UPI000760E1AD|nr:hypothetical protein [Burkholderia cenocepacia]KWU26380.1 hypothetical protein AS149_25665 [Burkholderia cenocepacia]
MRITWRWSYKARDISLNGIIEGIDLRDAVSRILTQDVGEGRLFGQVHGISVDILLQAPGNFERTLVISEKGFVLEVHAMPEMYVVREDRLLVLRQTRYIHQLRAGNEHPHDVCAYARDVAEMHSMIDKHWPDADFSAVS